MAGADGREITSALRAIAEGRIDAHEELMRLVYAELRSIAAHQCDNHPRSHTLQPTALLHEAFLRIFGTDAPPSFENRAHFFWAAARAMRDLLVESVRARGRLKRGGGAGHVGLTPDLPAADSPDVDLLALDEALNALQAVAPREARVVVLRYFGGLEHAEVAQVLGVAESTVRRDWAFAKAWLHRHLAAGGASPS